MNTARTTTIYILAIVLAGSVLPPAVRANIVRAHDAAPLERYAARELQRYIHQISGALLEIGAERRAGEPCFLIGTAGDIDSLKPDAASAWVKLTPEDPGPQGYVLKRIAIGADPAIVIGGSDPAGCLYGVYGLLQDHYGIGFYLGGDVLPERRAPLAVPDVDERKAPLAAIRGFLPWTNFPQSAGVYSWEDWRFIIDQAAKMRFNFIHIHNYNGEHGHNEMFHNFEVGGQLSRVWMPTAGTGHRWACPGWEAAEYRFGAAGLFDDYDFGSDCALHNQSLSNRQVFRKGASLFQRVIAHAHARGIRIGLGIDIDIIPHVYTRAGYKAEDPEVIAARVAQIARDYPELDYLLCFQSENVGKGNEFYEAWRRMFMSFYNGMKREAPATRLGVSGWGLDPAAIETLPEDVIAAPIAGYSAKCASGAKFGAREYWGCPWLERDWNSSQYYYPYHIHLSDTIAAWRNRAENMTGFYCLTWRLTDAVDAKMSYIAQAPWDQEGRLDSSEAVYRDYAVINYGEEAADAITAIINENEAYASNFGECQGTPGFVESGASDHLSNLAKAESQLETIDACMRRANSPADRDRLGNLRCRIAAVRDHNILIRTFHNWRWPDLPGAMPSWVGNFTHRVTDISSLGNVSSVQNRFIQQFYLEKLNELHQRQEVKAPLRVEARGARHGAVLTWRTGGGDAAGYNIYRDGRKLNAQALPAGSTRFEDRADGAFDYAVTAVSASGKESPLSVPARCAAGAADREPPEPVVISPPTSVAGGQPATVSVRLLDGRSDAVMRAELRYRALGAKSWRRAPMDRRVRAVFTATIPAAQIGPHGVEYYLTASDGDNETVYPPGAPDSNLSLIATAAEDRTPPPVPPAFLAAGGSLVWESSGEEAFWYKIYRGATADFEANAASFVSYVARDTHAFKDEAPGFDGKALQGARYYRVTALDFAGNESAATAPAKIE